MKKEAVSVAMSARLYTDLLIMAENCLLWNCKREKSVVCKIRSCYCKRKLIGDKKNEFFFFFFSNARNLGAANGRINGTPELCKGLNYFFLSSLRKMNKESWRCLWGDKVVFGLNGNIWNMRLTVSRNWKRFLCKNWLSWKHA